ncbi:OprD family outer membrane porin [Campylobacter sp. faydin G-24]|uniref:OprD family outer membrane porin n=1 Tax=Campylobacter anatolicus TaxID=2829105 RepID=A0ABS5HK17_9BACT|nr:OprD family outer membrane porin [Campylobacter anatolicus]MBR8464345.1 OprD family outer membrane porin [Campylobacter anatolicus]
MKLRRLSLVTAVALGCLSSANAADTLAEAFTNGKLSTTLKATYADQTSEFAANKPLNNEHIFGIGAELGYVTDPFYGFRIGLTGQTWGSISPEKNAKTMYKTEWYANGAVLSELFLGYGVGKTDIKFGRQYVSSPLVAGNPTRAYKEAFEGLSITNKDIPDTTLFAGWYYKFQGRSKTAMQGSANSDVGAPVFKDRVIVSGMSGPYALKFDNIFTGAIINQSIPGLKLTGAYARGTDIKRSVDVKGDVDTFLVEGNYRLPVSNFKLGFDAMYKGSRVDNALGTYDGDMLGFRAGIYDFYGFGFSYAFTTVSDDDGLVFGFGNGPASYTMLPIRGPYVFTGYAGMNTHKLTLDYDFSSIGINGLKTSLQYVKGEQDTPSAQAGSTAAGTHMDVEGWSIVANYAVQQVKGLNVAITYTELDRENYNASNVRTDTDNDELWVKLSYKFDLLGK